MDSLLLLTLTISLMFTGGQCYSQSTSCSTVNGKTTCESQRGPGNMAGAASNAQTGPGGSYQDASAMIANSNTGQYDSSRTQMGNMPPRGPGGFGPGAGAFAGGFAFPFGAPMFGGGSGSATGTSASDSANTGTSSTSFTSTSGSDGTGGAFAGSGVGGAFAGPGAAFAGSGAGGAFAGSGGFVGGLPFPFGVPTFGGGSSVFSGTNAIDSESTGSTSATSTSGSDGTGAGGFAGPSSGGFVGSASGGFAGFGGSGVFVGGGAVPGFGTGSGVFVGVPARGLNPFDFVFGAGGFPFGRR